jgi:chromosome partitioning protein
MGKRVAVVDMDPQSNLSLSFGIEVVEDQPHAFDLLSGAARWDEVLVRREGVDIAPSSLDLVMVELHPEGQIGKDTLLKEVVSAIGEDRYDFLFFDSPPQLGVFTRNVLSASDRLIVPVDGGFYSLSGLRLLYNAIPLFKERLNPELSFLGVLLTRHSPNVFIHREVAAEIRNFFGNLLFDAYVRQNVSLVEASSLGISVFSYDTASNGARDYENVTLEFLKRCDAHG